MPRRLLAIFLPYFLAGISVSPAFSQQTPGSTIKTQTNLVLVPVEVRNKGQHVPGLAKDAFTLTQDGKEQKIAVFEEVRTTTERIKRVPVAPNQFTNELVGNPQTARYTVLAIDRINTKTIDLARVRDGLLKFLDKAADNGEPIKLVSIELNGIRTIHDFTTDPKAIAIALQKASTNTQKIEHSSSELNAVLQELDAAATLDPNMSAERLQQYLTSLDRVKQGEQDIMAFQERTARINSLEALQQIAQSLSGLPGRKSLVWASSGYPFSSLAREGRTAVKYDVSQVTEAIALDQTTTNMLNAANIALYPVDAAGLRNESWDYMNPSNKYSATDSQKEFASGHMQDIHTTFERLASQTGGKPCYNRADLEPCFREAMDDSRDYYMLGYYLETKDLKPGFHKLQVKVPNASTRSRNGFLYPLLDPSADKTEDIRLAVTSFLNNPGIPFKGEWTTTEKKGDKAANSFVLKISPSAQIVSATENHLNIEIAGIARAKNGSIVAQFDQKIDRVLPPEAVTQIQNNGLTYKNTISLAPGEYLVRFVVRNNNNGQLGATSTLLKVE